MAQVNALDIFVSHSIVTEKLTLEDVSLLKCVSKTYQIMLENLDENKLFENSLDTVQINKDKIKKPNCLNELNFYKERYRINNLIRRLEETKVNEYFDKLIKNDMSTLFSITENISLNCQQNTLLYLFEFAFKTYFETQFFVVYIVFWFIQQSFLKIKPSHRKIKKYSLFANDKFYNVLLQKLDYYHDVVKDYPFMLWNETFRNDLMNLLDGIKEQIKII